MDKVKGRISHVFAGVVGMTMHARLVANTNTNTLGPALRKVYELGTKALRRVSSDADSVFHAEEHTRIRSVE